MLRICALLILAEQLTFAAGWTQYRGTKQDAAATEPIRTNWTELRPQVLWRKTMSPGLSSFSVGADQRLYTMGWRRSQGTDTEFCIAMHASTGEEIWAAPIGLADYPYGGVGSDDGPRSTPTVDGDRVFAFGSYMNLVCLDSETGAKIWSRDLVAEFGANVIPWENAASPTLVGDLIFVNSNGRNGEHLIAFRKSDGAVIWKLGSYGMTHATPVAGTIHGTNQLLFLGQRALVAVNPESGVVLWDYPLNYNGTSVAASPVVSGNTVYISRAYPGSLSRAQAGALVLEIANDTGTLRATRKWERVNQLMNHWATPVFYEGHYYGVFGQSTLTLRCVDSANGDTKWERPGVGYGSVSRAGDKLIVLEADGQIALVETDPSGYRELARFQPLDAKCWNNPAISGGRIYIRGTTEAVALDVSTTIPNPARPLVIGVTRISANSLSLEIRSDDGTPIDSARVSGIAVSSRSNLAPGAWTNLTITPTFANGRLTLENLPNDSDFRFFRTEERP